VKKYPGEGLKKEVKKKGKGFCPKKCARLPIWETPLKGFPPKMGSSKTQMPWKLLGKKNWVKEYPLKWEMKRLGITS